MIIYKGLRLRQGRNLRPSQQSALQMRHLEFEIEMDMKL